MFKPATSTAAPPVYPIRFPDPAVHLEQDCELCEVQIDGAWHRFRFHDYDRIYQHPGLYEQLFYNLLRCDSPRTVVNLLCRTLHDRGGAATQLSVLDVGAGNGMVGEELRKHGVSRVIGLDILPEARAAAERDRAEIYDDYLVADLTALNEHDEARMVRFEPDALVTVAALGFGDIPPEAFAAAFNAITTPGWVAFNIRDAFLNRSDTSGFSRLIHEMADQQYIQIEASQRYVHRLSSDGAPIEYVALVAKKLKDLPKPLPAELTGVTRRLAARRPESEVMIEFCGVSKSFGANSVVSDLSLEIHAGELIALVGGSGAGKTTALKMINRLIEPTIGSILLDGVDTRMVNPIELRRDIGYVFQGIGLFPHMTVAENVATVPRLLNWSPADISKRVDELLNVVGLAPDEYRLRRPRELSGGQQQRVGFARALAAYPKLLLMDEPFGALDPLTRDALQREFALLHRRLQLTSVMVTHDMAEALLLADRIAVMNGGRLVQLGTPHELLTQPADQYVASLLATPREQAQRLEDLMEENAGKDTE